MGIAIIGCGASGKAIAYQIARNNVFSVVKLIDVNESKIKKLSKDLKNINDEIDFFPLTIDAKNSEEIKTILDDVSVIINASSPIFNLPIMNACLETNTNYIDLASDPFSYSDIAEGTTLDEQLVLDDSFKKKDLVAVTNAGFSPGFTDIFCKYVATKYNLDSIESLKVYFAEYIKTDKLIVSWSPYIFLLESISPPTVYKNGEIIDMSLIDSLKKISFPEPMGEIDIRPFNGHPELRTIPEFIGLPIRYIEISGGMKLNDLQLNDLIVEALIKQVNNSPLFKGDIFEILSSSFEDIDKFVEYYKTGVIEKDYGCCFIKIVGESDNKTVEYDATINHCLKDEIDKVPSSISSLFVSFIPAILADLIKKGEIKNKGVIGPAAINIAPYIIRECKKVGMNIKEKCNV